MIISFSNTPSSFPPASTLKLSAETLKQLALADRRRKEAEKKKEA